jgi:hypothetical protein
MVRRYGEEVLVKPAPPAGDDEDRPASFLWRGRLYVVRDVLGHWRENTSWWSSPAARAVHGESSSHPGDEPAGAADPGTSRSSSRTALCTEREVWRVEASRGRAFDSGVYDLCRDRPVAAGVATEEPWHLLRVAD